MPGLLFDDDAASRRLPLRRRSRYRSCGGFAQGPHPGDQLWRFRSAARSIPQALLGGTAGTTPGRLRRVSAKPQRPSVRPTPQSAEQRRSGPVGSHARGTSRRRRPASAVHGVRSSSAVVKASRRADRRPVGRRERQNSRRRCRATAHTCAAGRFKTVHRVSGTGAPSREVTNRHQQVAQQPRPSRHRRWSQTFRTSTATRWSSRSWLACTGAQTADGPGRRRSRQAASSPPNGVSMLARAQATTTARCSAGEEGRVARGARQTAVGPVGKNLPAGSACKARRGLR